MFDRNLTARASERRLCRQTKDLLRQLGSGPEVIAQRLGDLGAKGPVGHTDRGALAVFLKTLIGTEPSVGAVVVTARRVRIEVNTRRRALSVWLPLTVRNFMTAFDYGAYPKLVRWDLGVAQAGASDTRR